MSYLLNVAALERIRQRAQLQGQEEAEGDNEENGESSSEHDEVHNYYINGVMRMCITFLCICMCNKIFGYNDKV